MSRESLEQFKEVVLKYTTLQERLKATADRESFVKLAVKLGEESGYYFTAEEIEEALQEEVQRLAQQPTVEDVIERFKKESVSINSY